MTTTETTRGRRILASTAKPGWYRARQGQRLKLLAAPHKAHGMQPAIGYRPYFSPGNPRAKSAVDRYPVRGWVGPDYPLLPIRTKTKE
jgi:hypothetical protein